MGFCYLILPVWTLLRQNKILPNSISVIHTLNSRGLIEKFIVSIILYSVVVVAIADNAIPKLVYLVFDEDKIIASNIEFNRFDELSLTAKEEVISHEVGNAVAVVVTNKRIMAYSIYKIGWVTKETQANEIVNSVTAEDYSALVATSKRFLSFNGKTGSWAETPRKKIFK